MQITSEEVKTISSCSEYSYQLKNNKSYFTKRTLSMPRLSKEDRDRAIGMLQVGRPKRQVAQRFGCTVRM